MRRAIALAQPHHTHPNPRVGAVLVDRDGEVIGEGAHAGPGTDHAEVVAIKAATGDTNGGTIYVTLEPCTHHGRTPPCVDAVIEAGISTVVIGASDPDPRVSGSGVSRLRGSEIEVFEDVLEEESRQVDPGYFSHRETGLPRVTLKYAMTLDGNAAATDGTSQWITGEDARLDAHRLRSEMDAVVVGAGTLRSDDPLLDVRLPDYEGPQPRPVIVIGSGEVPPGRRIWGRDPVVFSSTDVPIPAGELIVVRSEGGLPAPRAVCETLGELGYLDLLLEGGPRLSGSWWRAGVVNKGVVYVGSRIGGGTGIQPLAGSFPTIEGSTVVKVSSVRTLVADQRIDFELS